MKNEPFFNFTAAIVLVGVLAAFANPAAKSVPQPVPAPAAPLPVSLVAAPNTAPAAALEVTRPHRHHRAVQKS